MGNVDQSARKFPLPKPGIMDIAAYVPGKFKALNWFPLPAMLS